MFKEIDQEIMKLTYNPAEVLAYKGEKIESFKKGEGKAVGNKYIVVKREKVSMKDSAVDIGIVDSIVNLTFPGALLKANTKLVENQPEPIALARKPIKYVIDLPGMKDEALFTVTNPDFGSVQTEIEKKFCLWNEKYAKGQSIVARSDYSESMIRSESHMLAKFGFGMKKTNKTLDIDFKMIQDSKISVFIAAFRQIFYTVSMASLPEYPSNLLDDKVTCADLRRWMDNENPPGFVYKVAYGRTIFVKMQSEYTSTEVEAAFKAAIHDVNAAAKAEYKKVLENTSFVAVVLGGGTECQDKIIQMKSYAEIKDIITQYSTCSATNPGYPISYSTCFLKDNKLAAINSSTEYVKSTSTEYQNAEIILQHDGAYVAQFKVEWDEVTYDKDGEEHIAKKSWAGNLQDRTSSFSTVITLQGNSENVCVFAKECTGLAWEWWRTIFDKRNIPLVDKRVFQIYGTTLNQAYKINPEC